MAILESLLQAREYLEDSNRLRSRIFQSDSIEHLERNIDLLDSSLYNMSNCLEKILEILKEKETNG